MWQRRKEAAGRTQQIKSVAAHEHDYVAEIKFKSSQYMRVQVTELCRNVFMTCVLTFLKHRVITEEGEGRASAFEMLLQSGPLHFRQALSCVPVHTPHPTLERPEGPPGTDQQGANGCERKVNGRMEEVKEREGHIQEWGLTIER